MQKREPLVASGSQQKEPICAPSVPNRQVTRMREKEKGWGAQVCGGGGGGGDFAGRLNPEVEKLYFKFVFFLSFL